ncbi:hypothetical protein SOM61_03345 [Massilia sp. CFBP9012]|uniref:hypothetical protein n=1 Tax=Massilia sp. CFBP9012 TaxID=3096531 RepID=UPI002A6A9DAA|nr:hypothetical protein [Massilia sp. CFBP9012]MDY0973987.1 hypothetical protein [Massilia sp. CFBP9012]
MKFSRLTSAVILIAAFASSPSDAVEPKIYTVVSNGVKFRHFEVDLSSTNTLLPRDITGRERLDDTSENFKYGQFEVFIRPTSLSLPNRCNGNYIVRMPQSIDEDGHEVERKQKLYYQIEQAAHDPVKVVPVVLELSEDPAYACNLFFRTDARGRHIDYVGKIRR